MWKITQDFGGVLRTANDVLIAVAGENFFLGSHVNMFGDEAMDRLPIGNFLSVYGHETETAELSRAVGMQFLSRFPHLSESDPLVKYSYRYPWGNAAVKQEDVDLVFYMHNALAAMNLYERDEWLGLLRETLLRR